MHNLILQSVAGWNNVERLTHTLDQTMNEPDCPNDYYNCLIDCENDR